MVKKERKKERNRLDKGVLAPKGKSRNLERESQPNNARWLSIPIG